MHSITELNNDLRTMIERLLACDELTADDLQQSTLNTINEANALLKKCNHEDYQIHGVISINAKCEVSIDTFGLMDRADIIRLDGEGADPRETAEHKLMHILLGKVSEYMEGVHKEAARRLKADPRLNEKTQKIVAKYLHDPSEMRRQLQKLIDDESTPEASAE